MYFQAVCFVICCHIKEAPKANSVDPDKTSPMNRQLHREQSDSGPHCLCASQFICCKSENSSRQNQQNLAAGL